MSNIIDQVKKLPQAPGVYFFYDGEKNLLYIGKATNLRSRVQSYFRGQHNRGEWIDRMISMIASIAFQQTDSVLEALILESNLIKKHQPKYNTLEKDDKSFAYFVITKEEFPRVLILRKTDINKADSNLRMNANQRIKKIQNTKYPPRLVETSTRRRKAGDIQYTKTYGPYTSKFQMQIALKIIRRIFPFHAHKAKSEKGCLDFQMGVCPGPYANAISAEEYKKNIRGIRMILEGKKKRLISTLQKEMKEAAKEHEFEKAANLRNKIYALEHIRDVALMTRDFENSEAFSVETQDLAPLRIEAYDISNIAGDHAVASMVVFENKQPNKNQYRKFNIKTVVGANDVASMREVLKRRFKNDWAMPDLILLDGGLGHLNMAEKLVYEELGLAVAIASVAKGPERKKLELRILHQEKVDLKILELLNDQHFLKNIMDEAHRFAITFHRHKRKKGMLA